MSNIISADFYRVRHGAALRNTFIGMVAIIVLIMSIILFSQSEAASSVLAAPENMSAAEVTEMEQDLAEMEEDTAHVNSGAAFGLEILGQFIAGFLFLPIAIAVFCADFSAGTYRNTLSYESNRLRVYLAKLVLSTVLCLALVLAMLIISWVLGSIAFGFAGFSAAYFSRVLTILLLQLPIYLAFVAVCHCIISFTKKSGSTIAIFLVGGIVLSLVLLSLASNFPALEWAALLEPQNAGKIMMVYDEVPLNDILFIIGYNIGITGAATLLGLSYYRKTDMP